MALRGNFSQSFLRSKELLSFSEISYNKEGNNILENGILREALARNSEGELIRNKVNIAKILNKYGIVYRMVFNAMNMDQYTYDEVQESLDYLSEYINDLGISGIIEFHASDKTQNSDHIHFWISSEDKLIYNKIAQEMVAIGYSNKEDVYIQKYGNNGKLDEKEYLNNENQTLSNRFLLKQSENKPNHQVLDTLQKKCNSIFDNINNLLKEAPYQHLSFLKKTSIIENCTLPKTMETNSILLKIAKLRESVSKK